MKNYSIDSIDITFCSKTMPTILNSIELCQKCNLIPLPPYRSNKQSDITLCKACYLSKNKNFDSTIIPSKIEMKLMDSLLKDVMRNSPFKICKILYFINKSAK